MSRGDVDQNGTGAGEPVGGAGSLPGEPIGEAAAGAKTSSREPRLKNAPLMPETGAGGAPLTALIAVISFLATLALAAFIMIAVAAANWTTELQTSLTVQVKGDNQAAIETAAAAALEVLSETEGVIDTRLITTDEAAKMLEPWLGKNNVGDYLNIPALIEVQASEALRADLTGLRARLADAAPGAVVDDHRSWNERLANAARSGQALAFAVFVLVMGAACAISMFAARAGLAANSEVVALLHLVGATDDFIARQVQRRFLFIGLRGAAAGLFLALVALGLAALAAKTGADSYFLPGVSLGPGLVLPLFAVPLAICLVTAMTARMTVMRTLSEEY